MAVFVQITDDLSNNYRFTQTAKTRPSVFSSRYTSNLGLHLTLYMVRNAFVDQCWGKTVPFTPHGKRGAYSQVVSELSG